MIGLDSGDKRDPEMHQAKKGNQWYFGETTSKEGYTIWRIKSNQPTPFYVDTIGKAVKECLK